MRTWLANIWDSCRSGFWFLPSLLALVALVAALSMPELDRSIGSATPEWAKTTSASARATLTTISGAMITVAGVVFSVTVVTLSITSSQFGPRLLRSFLSDSITQLALGACLASSLYCLVLLRTINKVDGSLFLPHLSIAFALCLSGITLAILILCIHRVAMAAQADNVVAEMAIDLNDSIERLFPERIGTAPAGSDPSHPSIEGLFEIPNADIAFVPSPKEGYLQAIENECILSIAIENQLVIRLLARPGDFVALQDQIAAVHPQEDLREPVSEQIGRAFLVGRRRTPQQDAECAVQELVEVAVRALSPGINDPFTAIRCIDRLAACLSRLAEREIPSPFRYDDEMNLRIIASPYTFTEILNTAFDQIRQNGVGSAVVVMRLLEGLERIAKTVQRNEDAQGIRRQLDMILRGAESCLAEQNDRQAARDCGARVIKALPWQLSRHSESQTTDSLAARV